MRKVGEFLMSSTPGWDDIQYLAPGVVDEEYVDWLVGLVREAEQKWKCQRKMLAGISCREQQEQDMEFIVAPCVSCTWMAKLQNEGGGQ